MTRTTDQTTDAAGQALRAAGYDPEPDGTGGYYVEVSVDTVEDTDAAHTAIHRALPDGWTVDWDGVGGDGLDVFRVRRDALDVWGDGDSDD